MNRLRLLIFLLFSLLAPSHGADSAGALLGEAEQLRVEGKLAEALDFLRVEAGKQAGIAPVLVSAAIWRSLPLQAATEKSAKELIENFLPADDPWGSVYRLYFAARTLDTKSMLSAAQMLKTPREFPSVALERAYHHWLIAQGQTELNAGLQVLTHRSFEALFALRDLDLILTRKADFLRTQTKDPAGANTLLAARDQLRTAYLAGSQQAMEKLFALSLTGDESGRGQLLEAMTKLPYLSAPEELNKTLERLGPDRAWSDLVQPLLDNELGVVANPPKLPEESSKLSQLVIQSPRQPEVRGGLKVYSDAVLSFCGMRLEAAKIEVSEKEPAPTSVTLRGAAKVSGHPIYARGLGADEIVLNPRTLELRLRGAVLLQSAAGEDRLTRGNLSIDGTLTQTERLEELFKTATDHDAKQEIARQMERFYPLESMPAEARYLLALEKLRSLLVWQAGFTNQNDDALLAQIASTPDQLPIDSPWREANPGEDWMRQDIPLSIWTEAKQRQEALPQASDRQKIKHAFFWLLPDRAHPEVKRSRELLKSIGPSEAIYPAARRWLGDLDRNNTVLTFDVQGSFAQGKPGRVILDARAADHVTFKLYRIERAEELAAVCDRIGTDFIFKNHLESTLFEQATRLSPAEAEAITSQNDQTAPIPLKFLKRPPVRQWEVTLSKLPRVALSSAFDDQWEEGEDWDGEADGRYFNDACREQIPRINRSYAREIEASPARLSSWQLARAIELTGQDLKEAGAYVLVVEANGQRACAPILVDPLQLVTRRCRDGIFAMVNTPDGLQPVPGAHFAGSGPVLNPEEKTDAEGVAFVRMLGLGNRALVAEHEGRFAIAGFGRVFAGLFPSDRWNQSYAVSARQLSGSSPAEVGHVFEDRLMAAVFTDRPTYRPGQKVQAKFILRELAGDGAKRDKAEELRFRANDFDVISRLKLLPVGTSMDYEVLDSGGRAVSQGNFTTNDFGTAAVSFDLNSEARTGEYALRLRYQGIDHVIPEAFHVKYYRRPNFEVEMQNVPEELTGKESLSFTVSSHYYSGQPVREGTSRVRLIRSGSWNPLVEDSQPLDPGGKTGFTLSLPQGDLGDLTLIVEVTDASGRTVTVTKILATPGSEGVVPPLADMPRFAAVGETLRIPATDVIQVTNRADQTSRQIACKGGIAELTLATPGWHTISAGSISREIFIYPEKGDLPNTLLFSTVSKARQEPGWVNLANYGDSFSPANESDSPMGPPQPVWAMFGTQKAEVGALLPVLVRIPNPPARIVFTVEGRTIVDYFTATVTTPFQVVNIPVTERWLPNAYLQAGRIGTSPREVLAAREQLDELRDAEEDESDDPRWCRVDVVDPHALVRGEDLQIQIQTDREEYRPGDSVHATLTVTDKNGTAKAAEIALAAVDESVFVFGEGRDGSIAGRLHGAKPERRFLDKVWRQTEGRRNELGVALALADMAQAMERAAVALAGADQSAQLADASELERVARIPFAPPSLPVAEIPIAQLRQDFRETAAWLPQIRTDAQGKASADFVLPDSLTRYRLTALGLTRETEIGTARSTIRAALPVSVQLFLPRFAIEGDELTAVGMIHNDTDQARKLDVKWSVNASGVVRPKTEDFHDVGARGDIANVSWKVEVPARQQVRVTLPCRMLSPGQAILTLSVGDGSTMDAESRPWQVFPWGRHRELVHETTVTKDASFVFPEGFVPDTLQTSVSRQAPVQVQDALDGVRNLIDYPYGCVEQTMSRLMPAIVVRDAVRNTGFSLPPEVEAKLPEVIERGLTRLYKFQKADGGWGWWEKDGNDDRMGVYVLYGLVRCSTSGVAVNDECLGRGFQWLQGRLMQRTLREELVGRGWLVLALAGKADRKDLRAETLRLQQNPRAGHDTRVEMALACLAVGELNLADELWRGVRQEKVSGASSLALRLNAQLAFRAPLEDCYTTARELTALRRGFQFGSTWETARAIDGLARLLPLLPPPPKQTTEDWAEVKMGSKTLMNTRKIEGQSRAVSASFATRDLPPATGNDLSVRVSGDVPYQFTVAAKGRQKAEKMEPIGETLKITRSYRTLDGKPLEGTLEQGAVFEAVLDLELTRAREYILVEDPRPAGCEYAEDRLLGPLAEQAAHQEFRDDRVNAFFNHLGPGKHQLRYLLRAETPGLCRVLPGVVYPMYEEKERGETASNHLQIGNFPPVR